MLLKDAAGAMEFPELFAGLGRRRNCPRLHAGKYLPFVPSNTG
jgi:hypothetical protein